MKSKRILDILYATFFSILVFFSISFVSVLFQVNSPLHRWEEVYEFEMGFPFVFYYEFMIDCAIPIAGWIPSNLMLDFLIVWFISIGIYFLSKKKS